MALETRLTHLFGIEHPIVLAPMDYVADARLAAAVGSAGGLGLLGGGYTDEAWIRQQFDRTTDPVGCGFITWTLRGNEHVLDYVLDQHPKAIFLSFGDPAPYAPRIRAAGVPLICQVHNLEQATRAIEVGADVIVSQGGEAGGHGVGQRSTFTLVPEVVDLAAGAAPHVVVLAAGGVTDGRGLAAALALGADGVLVGTRFWAAHEAAISPAAQRRALRASGDDTIRQHVYDIVREKNWPGDYSGRVLHNDFVRKWHDREAQLVQRLAEAQADYEAAVEAEDYAVANVIIGEGIGQIERIESAADIVRSMVTQAAAILQRPVRI
ncbi:nitronate monooxygenase [Mycobacterium sp. CBMA271]|uniref:NAD(P)H-dependent flavin oxidoreductase n=1 Tax=unclassified Mycobacteroides TaxID=2618759 RepID=UPI0012DC7340|nr:MULTISPECIES: nitronate monooxygenase [unclassified Mycobacteroides]MUM17017.1 oxidoreductase [Mycobacteroides sp. CBMA 326]MUM23254.1 nitronate monooxygenase [Mycobacteroides sp. CBMA 271]